MSRRDWPVEAVENPRSHQKAGWGLDDGRSMDRRDRGQPIPAGQGHDLRPVPSIGKV